MSGRKGDSPYGNLCKNVNKVDIFFYPAIHQRMRNESKSDQDDPLLYLTDGQLRSGIEAMFFAYRGFTADPDRILAEQDYGRAHHRAVHFIHRHPGITVSGLIFILGISKQSLNRVLRRLITDQLVEIRIGDSDRRTRQLFLTEAGRHLEQRLSEAQRRRMRSAYRAAGPEAVAGFRKVLDNIMDPRYRSSMFHNKGS